MRVLHLFKRLDHGGAEMRTLDRLRYGSMADFDHHMLALSEQPGALDQRFREAGATIHTCRFDAGFPLRFARLLRKVRPDVVHANQQWMSAFFLSLAHSAGVAGRVCQFHASNDIVAETRLRTGRNRVLRRILRHEATAVTGVSEGVMDALWYPSWRSDPRCSVEYLGVDLASYDTPRTRASVRKELGIDPTARIAVHVGNMGTPKNHPGLGALFGELAARHPDLHLVAVGRRNPTFEEPMRAAAGHRDRLHVLGPRNDVPRLLLGSDLFLLPSVNEGLPTVVLEARAAGLPAVVSDLTGNLEIAKNLTRVDCVSLARPWTHWADVCDHALRTPPDSNLGSRNPLFGTPFDAEQSARAHAELWRRSVGR